MLWGRAQSGVAFLRTLHMSGATLLPHLTVPLLGPGFSSVSSYTRFFLFPLPLFMGFPLPRRPFPHTCPAYLLTFQILPQTAFSSEEPSPVSWAVLEPSCVFLSCHLCLLLVTPWTYLLYKLREGRTLPVFVCHRNPSARQTWARSKHSRKYWLGLLNEWGS